tara:strand:- start:4509 stop:4784 length:276 start_codon:yes stop_codon:yes gene_type:complete
VKYKKIHNLLEQLKLIIMNTDFLVTIVFIIVLVIFIYWYAGYSIRTGKLEDENKNFIPDSWEENFSWFFSLKGLIMFVLGVALGYTLHGVI